MKLTPAAMAALALVAGPAMAQSEVNLYGVVDAGLLNISTTSGAPQFGYLPTTANGGAKTQIKDGGLGASNWGIKGKEDLGGGLKASFQLQGNIKSTTGEGGGRNSTGGTSMFNQMATVGLSGGFGEVKLGRQVSPMYWAMASTDARGARYFGSSLTGLVGMNSASGVYSGASSNPAFGSVYNDNAVVYTSPTWNNLTFNIEYAFGNTPGSGKANSQEALTAVYDAKGLKLSALYYNGYGNNLLDATAIFTQKLGNASAAATALTAAGLTPTTNTNRLTGVGALYNWGPYTVSASWMAARNPSNILVVPNGSTSLDMWSIGGGWKLAPNMNLTAGYYKIKDNTNAGNTATQLAVGLDYLLSKRSTLYVEAASVTNHGNNMNLSPVYSTAVAANQNVHAVMMGLRTSF